MGGPALLYKHNTAASNQSQLFVCKRRLNKLHEGAKPVITKTPSTISDIKAEVSI